MENEVQTSTPAEKQRRSKIYPRYSLEPIISFVKTIEDIGGTRIPKATIAAEAKIPSNSSGFLGRVSSAKQFGLITVENEKFSTTPRANRIFHEISIEDKKAALNEAFSEPSLYKELIKKYHGKNLPPTPTLANVLMNDPESGLEKNACVSAASNFVQSAQYVGAIRNGMLVVSDIIDTSQNIATEETIEAQRPEHQQRHHTITTQPVHRQNSNNEFIFDFTGGIRLTIPNTTETSEAIANGELKLARQSLKDFSDKYLSAKNPKEAETE